VFIQHTSKEKIVNLDNVSNIFIESNYRNEGKIIFNMNYSVKIFGNKITPDYVYWRFSNKAELDFIKNIIDKNTDGWIKPQEELQRYINTKCISSIGTDELKNRVIFNLNYNVTHPKDELKLTSDFVFYNFKTHSKYVEFLNSLSQL